MDMYENLNKFINKLVYSVVKYGDKKIFEKFYQEFTIIN